MTTPLDPTILKPEEWTEYLHNAMDALRLNHNDHEALDAIKMANQALSAYDEASAVSPGERISAGVEGGIKGLGHMPGDLIHGLTNFALHPINTVLNVRQIPGQLAEGLSGNSDPETVARTIGNVGNMALPFAKLSGKVGLNAGAAAPTVAGAVGSAIAKPFRAGAELMRRPALKNALIEEQTATASARTKAAQAQVARSPLQEQLLQSRLKVQQQAEGRGPVQDELLQGRVKGQNLRNQATQQGIDQSSAAGPVNQNMLEQRLQMLGQQLEQMPAGAEKLGLTNELLRLRIELLTRKLNGDGGIEGGDEPPPTPPITPIPGSPTGPNGIPRGFNGPEGLDTRPVKPYEPTLHEQINGKPVRDMRPPLSMNPMEALKTARDKFNSMSDQDLIPTGGLEPAFDESTGPAPFQDLMSFTKHMPGVPEVDLMQYIQQFAKSLARGQAR